MALRSIVLENVRSFRERTTIALHSPLEVSVDGSVRLVDEDVDLDNGLDVKIPVVDNDGGKSGRWAVLVGPNGAGKSSVLSLLKLILNDDGHGQLPQSAYQVDLPSFMEATFFIPSFLWKAIDARLAKEDCCVRQLESAFSVLKRNGGEVSIRFQRDAQSDHFSNTVHQHLLERAFCADHGRRDRRDLNSLMTMFDIGPESQTQRDAKRSYPYQHPRHESLNPPSVLSDSCYLSTRFSGELSIASLAIRVLTWSLHDDPRDWNRIREEFNIISEGWTLH